MRLDFMKTPREALRQPAVFGYDAVGSGVYETEHPRQRVNILSLFFALLVPTVLFGVISGVVCFHARYSQPGLVFFIVVCGGFVPLICGTSAMQMDRRRRLGAPRRPTWLLFLFATSLFAWVSGLVTGQINYVTNALRYYEYAYLHLYPSIDPQADSGQEVLDAGRLVFTPGSRVDRSRAVSFKNVDTYCVAPVVSSDEHLGAYDFWATGVNCCGNAPVNATLRGTVNATLRGTMTAEADFHCGQDFNTTGAGGLRVLDDGLVPFFRLAVEQAKSKYHLNANHPIFFTWVQDPVGETNMYMDRALKSYLCSFLLFFGLQFFLVVFAAISFAPHS